MSSDAAVVLYDSVTLEHFAAVGRLPLLTQLHRACGEPRWVEQVEREVRAGAGMSVSQPHCQPVLDLEWMGDAAEHADLAETLRIRAILDDGSGDTQKHLGEAESIAFARAINATFVTDDAAAYDYACGRTVLGADRVKDMCVLLWEAMGAGLLTRDEIREIHIEVYDYGRHMRCKCGDWPGGATLDEKLRRLR